MSKSTHAIILCSALTAPLIASAVGFGRVTTVAVMGQPLVMDVPIRLDVGLSLKPDCVTAEVQSGDSKLPPEQVRVRLMPGATDLDWIARVTTTSPVVEPVLVVGVTAGCEQRFLRRYTAFAEPPTVSAAVKDGPGSPTRSAASPQAVASDGIDDWMLARVPAVAAARHGRRSPAPHVAGLDKGEAQPRHAKPSAKAPVVSPAVSAPSKLSVPQEAQVARLLLDVGGPRLKMDMEDPIMRVAGGVTPAASDASWASLGDDEQRLALLERSLTALRAESQASQDTAATLKAQLQASQSRARALPWLLALLVLTAGLAMWLAMRLRKNTRAPADGSPWWSSQVTSLDAVGPVEVPPISVAGDLREEPLDSVGDVNLDDDDLPRWSAPDALDTAPMPGPQATFNPSGTAILEPAPPSREVSVEELMDLEQQADFFIALGQEDAAIDLLMSHLRSTGGQSPLPYTKLLEIYRRHGDRGAYERIRARFNRRFNAYAPDWDAGPLQGRWLEDYPALIEHLQGLWQSPIDAMATLESMLFRKDDSADMFDLPAYKDVLLLYSLARDLWQQGGMGVTEVDLLLPLGDILPTVDELPPKPELAPLDYDLTSFQLEPPTPESDDKSEAATRHGQLN